ncbi:methylated-DNA--[protein]-cysteine S-methyltransferase [Pseudodesulfovibrio tunisiensis]|uniref:methylated-DNA--[protein]-cysteine S-methyltransferase n=1 Tax=Pseudodesulfovibrio tunisiensis TaxID=463192 RepID=UPI001FB4A75A|nr:MGMT family protein [Pseudodesulfovibrio tunisiensis]
MTTETIISGPLALILHWNGPLLDRLNITWSEGLASTPSPSGHARALQIALDDYVAGRTVIWPDLPFDMDRLTPFHRTVLHALRQIPSGTTLTYGQLAARSGNPKAARAIGRAMATNPWPLVYPCHRVIGSNGQLTGFSGSGGLDLKAFLLRHEGALPDENQDRGA